MYPSKEERESRMNKLRIQLDALNSQGERLTYEINKCQIEIKTLEYLDVLEREK
jgi:prefoldin subunit 5